jgi:hypothetical protein
LRFAAFQTTRWRSRRPISAGLLLVYFWTYVALGLVHTHAPARSAVPTSAGVAAAPTGQGGCAITAARAATGDPACSLCKAAHATAIALAQPPGTTHAPVRPQPVACLPITPAPTRSLPAPPSRGPPPV